MATVRLGLDEQCSLNINREYLFSFIEPLCLLHISDSESCTSCFKLRIRNLASSYEPLFTQTWNMTNNLQSWVLFENAKLHFFKFQVLTIQMILLCANVTYYKKPVLNCFLCWWIIWRLSLRVQWTLFTLSLRVQWTLFTLSQLKEQETCEHSLHFWHKLNIHCQPSSGKTRNV